MKRSFKVIRLAVIVSFMGLIGQKGFAASTTGTPAPANPTGSPTPEERKTPNFCYCRWESLRDDGSIAVGYMKRPPAVIIGTTDQQSKYKASGCTAMDEQITTATLVSGNTTKPVHSRLHCCQDGFEDPIPKKHTYSPPYISKDSAGHGCD